VRLILHWKRLDLWGFSGFCTTKIMTTILRLFMFKLLVYACQALVAAVFLDRLQQRTDKQTNDTQYPNIQLG
jgi:hypothetical protein